MALKTNQGQMDRWNIVSTLNYLSNEKELDIIVAKNKSTIIKRVKKLFQIRQGCRFNQKRFC